MAEDDEDEYQYRLVITQEKKREWMEHVGKGEKYPTLKNLIVRAVENEISDNPIIPNDLAEQTSSDGGTVDIEPVIERLDDLEHKINQIDSTVGDIESEVEKSREDIDKITEAHIPELSIPEEDKDEVDVLSIRGEEEKYDKENVIKGILKSVPELDEFAIRQSIDRVKKQPEFVELEDEVRQYIVNLDIIDKN